MTRCEGDSSCGRSGLSVVGVARVGEEGRCRGWKSCSGCGGLRRSSGGDFVAVSSDEAMAATSWQFVGRRRAIGGRRLSLNAARVGAAGEVASPVVEPDSEGVGERAWVRSGVGS